MPVPPNRIDRKTALQTLVAGVVAAALCIVTWPFGFFSRFALAFSPAFLLLGVAGMIDPRILQGALKKPGESISHLPRWAKYVGYLCWAPTFVVLGWMLLESFAKWSK